MKEKEILKLTLKYMDATCAALYAAYLASADYNFLTARKYLAEFNGNIKHIYNGGKDEN